MIVCCFVQVHLFECLGWPLEQYPANYVRNIASFEARIDLEHRLRLEKTKSDIKLASTLFGVSQSVLNIALGAGE